MSNQKRSYKIVIGSKKFFDKHVILLESELSSKDEEYKIDNFLNLVRLSDEKRQRGIPFEDNDKATYLLVKNDNYLGIVESAHDRIGSLIEELTLNDAKVYVHNPPTNLNDYLIGLKARLEIDLSFEREEYEIDRQPEKFKENIIEISKNILGQNYAISEISKSLWYITTVNRKRPYVIMLYGASSLGKSEMAREMSRRFFKGRMLEIHLSMYKNDLYSYYFFGDRPNRRSLGFDLLERESNLVFMDELDKCPEHFYSAFYTLFDNTIFKDSTYTLDVTGLLIILTSNYDNDNEMKEKLGLPIYNRIDKFIHFENFKEDTIYAITMDEIKGYIKECQGRLTEEQVYKIVSSNIRVSGENARTIKNKVQEVVEELLYCEVEIDKQDDS